MTKPKPETIKKWLEDDKYWKWGIFYHNPEDDRLLPPKRNPAMGWTVNFANKKSVLLFVFLLLIPILVVVTTILLSKI